MAEPMTPEALGAIRARRDGAVRLAMRERLAERAQRGSWSATAAVALGIMDEDAADIAALLAEVERLRAVKPAIAAWLRAEGKRYAGRIAEPGGMAAVAASAAYHDAADAVERDEFTGRTS